MNIEPAYITVYNSLHSKILGGEYKIGTMLPPEPMLEKIYRVSRTTVRRAVTMLAHNGYVKTQPGVGTSVLDFSLSQNLNTITGMTETLQKRGYVVSLKEIRIDIISAEFTEAAALDVPLGTKLARVKRVQRASGIPIAIIYNYIPYSFVEGIENCVGDFTSLYNFLEQRYFLYFNTCQDKITAKNATAEEAEMLEVPTGTALTHICRKCINGDKRICYDDLLIRPDKYAFDVTLHRK